jgi:polyisoprenoid-binding protein YceI
MKKLALLLGCVALIVLLASFTAPTTETVTVKHATISKETAHGGMSTGRTHGTDW